MSSSIPTECHTTTFEWTIRGLKEIFESTEGSAKSQVILSERFGGGQWQLLLYANSGDSGTHISLYLSAEPTQEEEGKAVDKQSHENARPIQFKEAFNHHFSHVTPNWGWAQLASRNAVYYHLPEVQERDSFLIVCQVTRQV